MTLYEMTMDYLRLLEISEDPDTDPQVFADTLEGLTGEIEDKAEGYITVIKELEARAAKFEKEIKRLTDQKTVYQNNIKRLKEALLNAMDAMGTTKVTTDHFRVSVAKNGGLQPLYVMPQIDQIPSEYIEHVSKVDTDKIRRALDAGADLPFAHFEERGRHLNIK